MYVSKFIRVCGAFALSVSGGVLTGSEPSMGAPIGAGAASIGTTSSVAPALSAPGSSLVAQYDQIAAVADRPGSASTSGAESALWHLRAEGVVPRLYNASPVIDVGPEHIGPGQQGGPGKAPWVGAEQKSLGRATGESPCITPGDSCSLNWAGLEDWSTSGSSFTGIRASWVVPAVTADAAQSAQDTSTWIGLDGDPIFDHSPDPSLIQVGTDSPARNGQVFGYEAWYELLPGDAIPLFPISAGDTMGAVITETSPGLWSVAIEDLSKDTAWATSGISYSSPGYSAEWIQEATSYCSTQCSISELEDFGSITFSAMQYSAAGATENGAEDAYDQLDYTVGTGDNTLDYPTINSRTSMTVTEGTAPAGHGTSPTPGQGALSGTVSTGSSPQPGVCVNAFGSDGVEEYSALTGSDGSFAFSDVVPDSYRIFADPTCAGEVSSSLAQMFYGGSDYGDATAIAVPSGSVLTGTAVVLPVAASISGTVTGPDGLADGLCVNAIAADGYAVGSTQTAADGRYTVGNLPAASYVVEFDPTCHTTDDADAGDGVLFNGGATSFSGATPISVAVGQAVTSEDATLSQGETISGSVSALGASNGFSDVCVSASATQSSANALISTTTWSDGSFSLTNLPPGNFYVYFDPTCGGSLLTDFSSAWYNNGSPVTAGSSLTDQALVDIISPPSVLTSTLTAGAVGLGFFESVQATGGTPGWQWMVSGLPSGLSSSPGGVIYGTPAQSGDFTVSVQATDSSNEGQAQLVSPVEDLSLVISPASGGDSSGGGGGGGSSGGGSSGGGSSGAGGGVVPRPTTTSTSGPTTTTTPLSGGTTTTTPSATTTTTSAVPLPAGSPKGTYGHPTIVVLGAKGGAEQVRSGGTSGTVSVPAGALPPGTKLSIAAASNPTALEKQIPSGQSFLVSFSVSWRAPNGTTPKAAKPISITIVDPAIKAGDTIYMLTSGGLKPVGLATANGRVTVTFTTDPNFVVAAVPVVSHIGRSGQTKGRVLYLTVSCASATKCTGSGAVTISSGKGPHAKKSVLAVGSFAVPAGHTKTVALALTTFGRALVSARDVKHLSAQVVLKVKGGKATSSTISLP